MHNREKKKYDHHPNLNMETPFSLSASRSEWRGLQEGRFRTIDCLWNQDDGECIPVSELLENQNSWKESARSDTASKEDRYEGYIKYQYSCPLSPVYPADEPVPFLPDWMSSLMKKIPAFGYMPLSSLSLPGTHDSISYDLSLTISSDGIDQFNTLNDWLRKLSIVHPGEVEEFIRLQAQAQKLDIVQQLDNGVRFIDFRIMRERLVYVDDDNDGNSNDWFSIHCMQSTRPALDYLQSIRTWMDDHPSEIIVIWFSRSGSTNAVGDDAYPSVSRKEKYAFWASYQELFETLLFDTSLSNYYDTPMKDLIASNQRVVTFLSDYAEFSNSSKFAYDATRIQNFFHSDGVFNEELTLRQQRDYFHQDRVRRGVVDGVDSITTESKEKFHLMSMNTPSNTWQVESAARHRFLPVDLFDPCAKNVNIPSSHSFCPQNLLDIAQLANYYNQISIEEAYRDFISESEEVVSFPNAFYLDALDYNGTLRTGTELLSGQIHPGTNEAYHLARYAFVDTIIGYNVYLSCRLSDEGDDSMYQKEACDTMKIFIEDRRARYPQSLWHEPEFGRLEDWP